MKNGRSTRFSLSDLLSKIGSNEKFSRWPHSSYLCQTLSQPEFCHSCQVILVITVNTSAVDLEKRKTFLPKSKQCEVRFLTNSVLIKASSTLPKGGRRFNRSIVRNTRWFNRVLKSSDYRRGFPTNWNVRISKEFAVKYWKIWPL